MAARKGAKSTTGKEPDQESDQARVEEAAAKNASPDSANSKSTGAESGSPDSPSPKSAPEEGSKADTSDAGDRKDKAKAEKAGETPEAEKAKDAVIKSDGDTSPAAAAEISDFDPYRQDDLQDDDDFRHAALDPVHDDEHGHRSLAATALAVLVGVIFVASLTLWAAPKVAPHLPAGVGKYLMPGEAQAAARLAKLEEALAQQEARAGSEIAALQAEVSALAVQLEANAASEAAEAAKATAEGAAADVAALAVHIATIDEELAGIRSELTAVSGALSEAAEGAGATPPELAAKLASLGARLDAISSTVEEGAGTQALDKKIAALAARMDAVERSAADAQNQQSAALGEVETALQAARLQAALDVLSSRLTNGLPYGAKLNEAAGIAGKAPPEALSAGAAGGVATATELEATYSRFANAAVAADVRAQGGDGALGAIGWLRSQVAGRPIEEQEGDSVGAITSRIGARVSEGDLSAALAEAETLPEHAQAGLGRWLERLRARVSAEASLEAWRAEIGAGG